MTMHTKVSSVWKELLEGHERVSGVWKQFQAGFERVGGVWKRFYPAFFVASDTYQDDEASPGLGAEANITYFDDGEIEVLLAGSGAIEVGEWITPTNLAPGAYTIRADVAAGSLSYGSTGSDIAISTSPTWGVARAPGAGVGTSSCTLNFTLKDGGGTTLATGTVTLQATINF